MTAKDVRRRFSDEQKREAVALAVKVGSGEAGRLLDIDRCQINTWRRAANGKLGKTRKRYTPAQREKALARADEIGAKAAAIEAGIKTKTLFAWRTAAAKARGVKFRRDPTVVVSVLPAKEILASHWPGKCLRVIADRNAIRTRFYLHPRAVMPPRGCEMVSQFQVAANGTHRQAYMDGEAVVQTAVLSLHPEVLDALAAVAATGPQEAAINLLAAARQVDTASAVNAMRALHSEGFFRAAHTHADRLSLAALAARDLMAKTKEAENDD